MLAASRCLACGATWCPPIERCAACGGNVSASTPLAGGGRVRSVVPVHSAARSPVPWDLLHVEADDGVWVVGFADAPVGIDDRVRLARIDEGVAVYLPEVGNG